MSLTNECLMCNVFKWSGQYYMQMRGLAMGQRLAPVLAVAFMFKVEKCCTFLHRRDGVLDLGRENRGDDVSILRKMA
ncbi:unnamed protein product [Heligmosomoides polygyrus]|uniref:Reverse transcriptase domain-containing protein n=1 Tax=Heligmosomoides polygyrus TaxID=6339 RepID=A0A183F613_HELPZ|nr:unnamed protein product [Heligmosomoides polygyrus]